MKYLQLINELKNQNIYFFSLNDLIKDYKLSSFEQAELIQELTNLNKIQIVFKLKTKELVCNFENTWTPHLPLLCKVFKTQSGALIDGSEFTNLEFKFKIIN